MIKGKPQKSPKIKSFIMLTFHFNYIESIVITVTVSHTETDMSTHANLFSLVLRAVTLPGVFVRRHQSPSEFE